MQTKHRMKNILIFCTACFLAVAAFGFLFQYDNKYTIRPEISQDGNALVDWERLDSRKLTYLVDGWELYPGLLLSPEEIVASPITSKKIFIGQYQNFSYFNSDGSPYGVATYRLRLQNNVFQDMQRQYVLLFQENFSACAVYVNGILSVSAGSLIPYLPHIMDLAVPVAVSGDAEIVVQIANYTHYYSGITYPPALGTAQAIHQQSFIRAGFYGFLCFTALALALFSIAVWFGSRKQNNQLYLWFGLLSLSFAVRVCYPFVRAVGIPVVRQLYALEDGAFMLGVWCALKIVFCLCGMEKSRLGTAVSYIAFHVFLVGVLFPVFVLPFLWTFVPVYGQIIFWYKLLTAVLLVGFSLYGALQGLHGSGWLLAGVGVYGTGLFAHAIMLNRFEPSYTGWQDEYGAFGLVVCFAVMMVLRSFQLVRENLRLNEHLQDEVDKKTKRLSTLLEERRHFLAGAAHDLKAPMASLQLFAQAVEENGIGFDDETLDSIRVIRQKSAEMQNRLMEIQSFAVEDAQPRKPERLDLAKLVSDFYSDNLPDMEASGIQFLLKLPTQPCIMMGEQQQLKRILQNIVYNALGFTEMDGTISIMLKRDKHFAFLEIADTGQGIDPEDLPHIFDRFFSRREGGDGSGLGLYLVKSFVLEHDGEVSVQSKLGEGTTFMIRFPLEP